MAPVSDAEGTGAAALPRTVVVTGAAHGLGREMVRRFAGAGDRVHAWDVRLDEVRASARLAGSGARARRVDVTDPDAVDEAVRSAEDEAASGAVDVLVNCAGGVLGQVGRPVDEVSPEAFDAVVRVNLTAAFLTARAVVPAMRTAGWGRIVNISSGAGLTFSKTGIQAYAAAKAGLLGLTRQLAHELGPSGITVNAVAPGFVRSNPDTERQWERYGPRGQESLVEGIALRRLGKPADIAAAVFFLASDQAGWITGQTLPVDGGR
jgi:3-oxoacyl-[acyl-carrier protein] reductase